MALFPFFTSTRKQNNGSSHTVTISFEVNHIEDLRSKINNCSTMIDAKNTALEIDTYENVVGRTIDVQKLRDELCDKTFDIFLK